MHSVSVIIPTWNRANTIKKAILSALNQTVQPLEILVCDDGSTDNTVDIVKSIGNPRVKWLPGPHSGRPAVPRNRGIKNCKGEWLAFLDSDDEWLPEKLEKQLDRISNIHCKASCTNAHRLLPDQGMQGDLISWNNGMLLYDDLLEVNPVICSSALVHKSVFDSVVGFPEDANLRTGQDHALWLRVATQTDFAFVNESLLLYMDDPSASIREAPSKDIWMHRRDAFSNFLAWASNNAIPKYYVKKAKKIYHKALWQIYRNNFLNYLFRTKI